MHYKTRSLSLSTNYPSRIARYLWVHPSHNCSLCARKFQFEVKSEQQAFSSRLTVFILSLSFLVEWSELSETFMLVFMIVWHTIARGRCYCRRRHHRARMIVNMSHADSDGIRSRQENKRKTFDLCWGDTCFFLFFHDSIFIQINLFSSLRQWKITNIAERWREGEKENAREGKHFDNIYRRGSTCVYSQLK